MFDLHFAVVFKYVYIDFNGGEEGAAIWRTFKMSFNFFFVEKP